MAKRAPKRQDYVRGLMTGRYVTQKDIDGKPIQVWKPSVENENLPLGKLIQDEDNETEKEALLVSEGLRLPALNIDRSVFEKSNEVKSFLKFLRRTNKRLVRQAGFDPKKRLNPSDPMVLTNRV